MVAPAFGEARLKDAPNAALGEALEERADLLRDFFAEVLEESQRAGHNSAPLRTSRVGLCA